MVDSTQPVTIIQAKLKHADVLAPLFDAYRVFYQQESDPETALRFLRERLSRREAVIFVALREGSALGFTLLYPTFSSLAMQREWILNDLYVAPEARKSGIGTMLLERVRQFAAETNARGLMLQTASENEPARRIYERLGWQRDDAFYTYYLRVQP